MNGSPEPGGLSRRTVALGLPLAGLALIALFVLLGFPYERMRDVLAARLARATGTRVSIAQLEPSLSLLGLGFAAEGVVTTLIDGTRVRIDRARFRPAWSTAWLGGNPAVFVDVEAPVGRARGTLYGGAEPRFNGRLHEVDFGQLPIASLVPQAGLEGIGESEVDVRRTASGAVGRVRIWGWDGSLALPGLPLALPFDELISEFRLGETSLVEIERFDLDGPMLALRVTGSVGNDRPLEDAPVRLDAHLEVREESLRPTLASMGIRVGPDGATDVRIVGTVASLVIH